MKCLSRWLYQVSEEENEQGCLSRPVLGVLLRRLIEYYFLEYSGETALPAR